MTRILRLFALLFSAGAAALSLAAKPLTVGFAQTGAESAWRVANTNSLKSEAEKRGITLKFEDGQGSQENQIRALRSFITQGVDAIVLAPIVETGWDAVLQEAQQAKIPVILMDRTVKVADAKLFACFVGSNFAEEGTMAAEWLARNRTQGRIVELQGTVGSAPANARHEAFVTAIGKHAGFTVVDAQPGDFRRDGGKAAMQALLKKNAGKFDVVYAHNDDMALGAIEALTEAGLKPGSQITIVSIDAVKDALQAIVAGKLNCSVECNPMFGPRVFDLVAKLVAGEKVPRVQFNQDELFDATNAGRVIAQRKY
jgi:simple sugar transport system substrate-binding protein